MDLVSQDIYTDPIHTYYYKEILDKCYGFGKEHMPAC